MMQDLEIPGHNGKHLRELEGIRTDLLLPPQLLLLLHAEHPGLLPTTMAFTSHPTFQAQLKPHLFQRFPGTSQLEQLLPHSALMDACILLMNLLVHFPHRCAP